MRVSNKKVIYRYIVPLVLALIAAIVFEMAIFMQETQVNFAGKAVSLMDESTCQMSAIGYEISDKQYQQIGSDPQITFSDIDRTVENILISFSEPVYSDIDIKVYYKTQEEEFSEGNSTPISEVTFAASDVIIEIPETEYDALRIDIDGSFSLENVIVSDHPITLSAVMSGPFSFLRFLTMFVIGAVICLWFVRWLYAERNERRLSGYELLFCLGCLAYYFVWAVVKPHDYAPDEAMRYDVTEFLFAHNRLPIGDELLSLWGFSYAHLPAVLCSQLGYVLMKIASVFTNDAHLLLHVARMVSVFCGAGAVYYIIKITKLLFKSPARWIMIILVAFMPQFAFLSSYVNNDIVAFFGISMIVYAWVLGIQYNWNFKNATQLSIGISICGLSYYNSYAWVLFSIFFFFITYFYQNRKDYKGAAKLAGFIVLLTFLLIGHAFIRHLVLYGDLLGFDTSHYYGEMYAIESLKPSNRFSIAEQGISLSTMLFDPAYQWFTLSWRSFVGVFGYMKYFCPEIVYNIAMWFVFIGSAGLVFKVIGSAIKNRTNPDILKMTFWICIALCAAVSVALSIYNSYNTDFQPQGRYCYPAFLPLAFFVAKGYEGIIQIFKKSEHKYAVTAVMCTGFIALSLFVFKIVYLPS